MALYKRGFKRQTTEQLLLKVIVGIIISVVVLVIAAFIFERTSVKHQYGDFPHIDEFSNVLNLIDEDENPINNYLVYFYQDNCKPCEKIQKTVLKLAHQINTEDLLVYFAKYGDMKDKNSVEEAQIIDYIGEARMVTPVIIVFVNGQIHEKAIGGEAIKALLTSIQAQTYEPFN